MRTLSSKLGRRKYKEAKLPRRGQTAARRPMFITMPEFQLHVPVPLAAPGAFYARAMGLTLHCAWYVLTIRFLDPEPGCETYLMAWDSDVVDTIKSSSGQLETLMIIAPHQERHRCGWLATQIAEVWEAIDPEQNDEPHVLMIAEDDREYSGHFMTAALGLKRQSLVARARIAGMKHHLDA